MMKYPKEKSKLFLKEYLTNILKEVLDKPIKTDYEKKVDQIVDGRVVDIYSFKTKSNNQYDVDFVYGTLNPEKTPFKSGMLSNLLIDDYKKDADYIDLGFSPTEVKNIEVPDDIIGTMDDPYIAKTNRMEQFELLGKVAFLIEEYVRNNPYYKIYSIGKNTNENNLSTYINIFKRIFSSNFIMFDEKNPDYKYGSYFFINKEIMV